MSEALTIAATLIARHEASYIARGRHLKDLSDAELKAALPSDSEKGALKPKKESEPSTPPPDDEEAKEDPSEHPS